MTEQVTRNLSRDNLHRALARISLVKAVLATFYLLTVVSFVQPLEASAKNLQLLAVKRATSFVLSYTPAKVKRVLPFPKDRSLGELYIGADATTSEEDSWPDAARGVVEVPPGKFVTFIPAGEFYKNPAVLKTLPPDGIDRLGIFNQSLDSSEDGFCDRALQYIGHLKGLLELKLDRSDASDDGVAHLKELPNVQKLSAFQCTFEGKCFKQLAGHPGLRYLRLSSSYVRNENLKYLAAIPHLEHLNLSHCNVTDEGVASLVACKGLISLDLADNPKITDKSLKSILALKNLRAIYLSGTSVENDATLALAGAHYTIVGLPQKIYDAGKFAKYKKAFPGTILAGRGSINHRVDADKAKLFAPLH